MNKRNCISYELKSAINVLRKAGYRPKVIKEILDAAGENISIRWVYELCKR